MDIVERENAIDKKGFLRWSGENPDWRVIPVARLHSIFPRAFKAVQESDISVYIKDGKAHLHHETAAEDFTVSRFSRPAMWITQSAMRKNHYDAFMMKPLCSRAWFDLEDNPASNHFLNWATSKYGDAILRFAIGIRLNTPKTLRTLKRDRAQDIQCVWCKEQNQDMAHIMTDCRGGTGWRYVMKRHRAIEDAVKAATREGIKDVHIQDDVRVSQICASITNEEGALKRPDLMYESTVMKKHKTLKIFNLTEITSLWSFENSLERAYQKKFEKYEVCVKHYSERRRTVTMRSD
jgi:hypothetical protein